MSMAIFVKVLKSLLADRVPIRAFRSIAEALAEVAPKSQDPVVLASAVRVALGRQIVQDINGMDAELPAYTLAPALERVLQDSLATGSVALEPGLAERMQQSIADGVQRQAAIGQPAVLLVPARCVRCWRASSARPCRICMCSRTTKCRKPNACACSARWASALTGTPLPPGEGQG
jgi:flagellar biosynthesis component FlhA